MLYNSKHIRFRVHILSTCGHVCVKLNSCTHDTFAKNKKKSHDFDNVTKRNAYLTEIIQINQICMFLGTYLMLYFCVVSTTITKDFGTLIALKMAY